MNAEQIAETILKLITKRSCDGYEITVGKSRNLSLEAKDGKVDAFTCSAPLGVSIRVLKSGGMGFSYSTSLSGSDLERKLVSST